MVADELAAVVKGLWNQVQASTARDLATFQEAAQLDIHTAQQQYHHEHQQRQALEIQLQKLEAALIQKQQDFQQLQQVIS